MIRSAKRQKAKHSQKSQYSPNKQRCENSPLGTLKDGSLTAGYLVVVLCFNPVKLALNTCSYAGCSEQSQPEVEDSGFPYCHRESEALFPFQFCSEAVELGAE